MGVRIDLGGLGGKEEEGEFAGGMYEIFKE